LEKRTKLHTLHGHEKRVKEIILSKDGKHAYSSSLDETIKIWDVEKRLLLKTLPGYAEIRSLAITPDDRLLIVSTSHFGVPASAVIIVDPTTGTHLSVLKGHAWDMNSVAVTPDGQKIISGSEDSKIKIWDTHTGEELAELKGHTGEIFHLSITSGGQQLVSAANSKVIHGFWDKTIRVWDLRKVPSRKEPECSRILFAAIRPNRCFVDPGFPEKAIQTLSQERSIKIRFVSSVDGQYGVSQEAGSDWEYSRDTLTVWDLAKGTELWKLTGHGRDLVDWKLTADGNYIVTASWDKTLKVYDYKQGQELVTLRGHNEKINTLCLTSDGQRALSAGDDKIIMVWNIPKGERLFSLWGHTDQVSDVEFSPDGKHVVSTSWDKTLRIWDLETRMEQYKILHTFVEAKAILVTPDGKQVIIRESDGTPSLGAQDFTIMVWDLETGGLIHTLAGHADLGIDALVTPDGRYLLSTSHDHTLRIWDMKTGQTVARFVGEDNLDIRAISPDGKTVLLQGQAGQTHFLRLEEHDFGPAIVTARRLPKPRGLFMSRKSQFLVEGTCIYCNQDFKVDDAKLGGELPCQVCGRLLRLNQTAL